jgi:hypothetical protein
VTEGVSAVVGERTARLTRIVNAKRPLKYAKNLPQNG